MGGLAAILGGWGGGGGPGGAHDNRWPMTNSDRPIRIEFFDGIKRFPQKLAAPPFLAFFLAFLDGPPLFSTFSRQKYFILLGSEFQPRSYTGSSAGCTPWLKPLGFSQRIFCLQRLSCSVAPSPFFQLFFGGCPTKNCPSPKKGSLFFQGH